MNSLDLLIFHRFKLEKAPIDGGFCLEFYRKPLNFGALADGCLTPSGMASGKAVQYFPRDVAIAQIGRGNSGITPTIYKG
ncbi:hypothetical protein [Laspinema palackyanum]|uniref:hypothetical protein n=1 Tax=Laspinema palackyanum TaxID=3231601 RepID=UPI00345CCF6B|nr:hypothetical protein [Laspinema sp. D2c]